MRKALGSNPSVSMHICMPRPGIETGDLQIFSLTLSQLSYRGKCFVISMSFHLLHTCTVARNMFAPMRGKAQYHAGCKVIISCYTFPPS